MIYSRKISTIFLIIVATILGARAAYKDEVRLTANEKAALDKFKALVIPKIPASSYVQNYIKDDLYFIRWVRTSRSLDVATAEESFLNKLRLLWQHLKWREDQRIDTILDEDWSELERNFPAFAGTVDKSGRPTFEAWIADWNVREAALTGKSRQVVRWVTKVLEQLNRHIYSSRAEGRQVTQAVGIVAVEGFNLVRQGCPACLPIYASVFLIYETHYKGILESIYVMDVPAAFQIVLRLVPAISPDLAKMLKIFRNKEEGLKALDKRFDKEQRGVPIGGTLTRINII